MWSQLFLLLGGTTLSMIHHPHTPSYVIICAINRGCGFHIPTGLFNHSCVYQRPWISNTRRNWAFPASPLRLPQVSWGEFHWGRGHGQTLPLICLVFHAWRQTGPNDRNNVILNHSFWKCMCKQTQIFYLIWETWTWRFTLPLILSVIYQTEKILGTSWATDEERWSCILCSCLC